MFKFAIIGRPNVGKSTFFNRLAGKKKAIVSNFYGITQDRQFSIANLGGLTFEIIDTAGIDKTEQKTNENDYIFQTKQAIEDTDFIFFVIDLSVGVLPFDYSLSKLLKKSGKEVILIGNKVDCKRKDNSFFEEKKLGFGDIILISSEHNIGFNNLYYKIKDILETKSFDCKKKNIVENREFSKDLIRVSFIGKPNTGKSTLINYILGETRLITNESSGTTRDAIEIKFRYHEQDFILTDTAGIRRKSNITNSIEKFSVKSTFNQIRKSDVCVLLIDSTENINKQDLLIAKKILEFGKGLIFTFNKWDSVKDKLEKKNNILDRLKKSFSQIKQVKVNTISAINGDGVSKLLKEIILTYNRYNNRIQTNKLNKWFEILVEKNPPPLINGKKNSLRYITQVKSKPPVFILFCTYPEKIVKSYIRYIENSLRGDFDFNGLPIKIDLKKGNNPYLKK